MLTSFPSSQPHTLMRASLPSQHPFHQAARFQPVSSQDEVLFGKKSDKPRTKPLPARPARPTKSSRKTINPDSLKAQMERLAKIQAEQEAIFAMLRQRKEFAEQIRVDMAIKLPMPKQYFYGYVMNSSVVDFMGLTTKATKAAAQILDNPDDLLELWLRLGMPDSELPEIDWEKEVAVFIAQSRTHQTTLKPTGIIYNRLFNRLAINLTPEEKTGKNPGMAWCLAAFPRVGQPTQEEVKRLQKHQALYEKFQSLPEKEKPKALVTTPPPKLSLLSGETKIGVSIPVSRKK